MDSKVPIVVIPKTNVYDPVKQCIGKIGHATPESALRAQHGHYMKFNEVLDYYLCPHCTYFHLGHKP